MPNYTNLPACTNLWSEQDINLYNKLDFYLAKTQVSFFKRWNVHVDLLDKQKWTANMGPIMKGVHKVPPPVLRTMFFPQDLDDMSRKDVIEVREVAEQARLRKHRFESQLMNFLPSFQDFLTDSVDATNDGIVQQISVAHDAFCRTYMFHAAPYIWVCGKAVELTSAPYITGSGMQEAKTQAFIQSIIPQVTGTLDLRNLNKIGTVMENDIAADYFEGSAGNQVSEGLKGKYCAVIGSEVWDNFVFDPYLLGNRPLDMNIVTDRFRGNLWGRWTTRLERFPIRIAEDGTFPVPEAVEENPAAYNYGDTVMNPAYVNAPIGVAWAYGASGYKTLQVGPPPAPFSRGEMGLKDFRAMDWNGKVSIISDILINCLDQDGNLVQDTNKYGEYRQLISQVIFGMIATRRRNVVPILYLRQRLGADI